MFIQRGIVLKIKSICEHAYPKVGKRSPPPSFAAFVTHDYLFGASQVLSNYFIKPVKAIYISSGVFCAMLLSMVPKIKQK